MRQPPLDPRTLLNVFILLFFAQLAFLGVTLLFLRSGYSFVFNPSDIFHYAIPLGVISLDYVAWNVFQRRINSASEENDIIERVNNLQAGYIVLWVMVQVGTFLLLTFSILEKNDYFILLSLGQIIYYSTLRPRLFNFLDELG